MMRLDGLIVVALCASGLSTAVAEGKGADFNTLAANCAPAVHSSTLRAIVITESTGNPFAIGVVAGRLARQPKTIDEAIATAQSLKAQGYNFSVGLAQVNRNHLAKAGAAYAAAFDPCRNLKAGAAILQDCYLRAKRHIANEQQALRKAFSCYYSGNFARGFIPDQPGQPSYVERVVANAGAPVEPIPVVPALKSQGAGEPSTQNARPVSQRSQRQRANDWVIDAVDADVDKQEGAPRPVDARSGHSDEEWLIDVDANDSAADVMEHDGPASIAEGRNDGAPINRVLEPVRLRAK